MDVNVVDSQAALAAAVAEFVGSLIEKHLYERDTAAVAFSGGSTPGPMLRALSDRAVPWKLVHVFQVDERIAPDESAERNATMLRRELLDRVPAVAHLMPVTDRDAEAAAARYAAELAAVCGGVLDVVHLGLGPDGHTASLVPGDAALTVADADVTVTGEYRGLRRMTLTYPALNRARARVWQVAGADKAGAVSALLSGGDVPAARVASHNSLLVVDRVAAPENERS